MQPPGTEAAAMQDTHSPSSPEAPPGPLWPQQVKDKRPQCSAAVNLSQGQGDTTQGVPGWEGARGEGGRPGSYTDGPSYA